MKVLVTGARGQLGLAVMEALQAEADIEVAAGSRLHLDITDRDAVREAVCRLKPRWIVNCAAYTDVEKAEAEPARAFLVNDTAVGALADAAMENNAGLIHVSTDYVFSGEFRNGRPRPYHEADAPGPLNVYGASKLAGEERLAAHAARSLVVRTSWLYGESERNFLAAMLRLGMQAMAGGPPLKVVADQRGTPTDCRSLAAQIALLVREDAAGLRGIVHASAQGDASWHEFACAIFLGTGWELPVEPIPASAYRSRARRPAYSVLENRRLKEHGLNLMPTWQEGLRSLLERRLDKKGQERQ